MDKHIIGENAGILWRFLSTDVHKRWLLTEVKMETNERCSADYEAPCVECMEVVVEQGFAASIEPSPTEEW